MPSLRDDDTAFPRSRRDGLGWFFRRVAGCLFGRQAPTESNGPPILGGMMSEIFNTYWPVILIALLIGLLVGFLIFRPRQTVRLTDSSPRRPHMAERSGETVFGHEAEVTTRHVLGAEGAAQRGPADDLERLKGVGPKLAAMLHARGLTRFDQIAKLTGSEIERIDEDLGAFRGRLQRDRIIEQADYLARGDLDGFEERFGKL
jgi:predicted flap endonuclease-1-like 5' DNA nuclease